MQLQGEDRAIVAEIAQHAGVPARALIDAVEHESVSELAHVLRIDEAEAARRLEPVRRTVAIGDDWGAGCKLLTDELRVELRTALRELLPTTAPSASSGVFQG